MFCNSVRRSITAEDHDAATLQLDILRGDRYAPHWERHSISVIVVQDSINGDRLSRDLDLPNSPVVGEPVFNQRPLSVQFGRNIRAPLGGAIVPEYVNDQGYGTDAESRDQECSPVHD